MPVGRLLAIVTGAVLTGMVALLAAPLGAGTAAAQPPIRLGDQVVDAAGVLAPGDGQRIQRAIDDLDADRGIQMWVVFVDDFGGLTPVEWIRRTVDLSDLGSRDVVLAAATAGGPDAGRLAVTDPIDGLTDDELRSITEDTLLPGLSKQRWVDTAVDAVTEVDDAADDDSRTGLIVGAVLAVLAVLIVLGIGLALLIRRRRGRSVGATASGTPTPAAESSNALTVDELADEPLGVLDAWSLEVLTATDDVVTTSADELDLAVEEFGVAATAPFSRALADAQQTLTASFAARHRLDRAPDVAEAERRGVLTQIITSCSDADALLDAQAPAFDRLRDLSTDADVRLGSLRDRVAQTTARIADGERLLVDLAARRGGTAPSFIADNIRLTREHMQFAEDSLVEGADAVTEPSEARGQAVAALRAAEGALCAADTLLDAVDSVCRTSARAGTGLPGLIAAVRAEVAAARRESADGVLDAEIDAAQKALDVADTLRDTDPLLAFGDLADADADLAAALDRLRGAPADHPRSAELVRNALETAEARTQAAADFVVARRGAIGARARILLSRAQQLGGGAVAAAESAPDRALVTARRASRVAAEALAAAEADVAAAGIDSAAVLAGILVDSIVRDEVTVGAARPAPRGFTAGGRSPASFGGSSTVGRIGTGERV